MDQSNMPIKTNEIKWDDDPIKPEQIKWDVINNDDVVWDDEKESNFVGGMMKGSLGLLKRGVGIGIGALNSPLAFVWGSQTEQHEDSDTAIPDNIRNELHPGEDEFFKANPKTTGMVSEAGDDKIILNPYSNLSEEEKQGVVINESSRLHMRKNNIVPDFEVTPEQLESFKGSLYEGNLDAIKQTIVGRVLSKDKSITPTSEQQKFADNLYNKESSYGKRADGTEKGKGYLGELKRPDGRVSTELSIGVDFGGKETEIPTLVPTLDKTEIDYLLNMPDKQGFDKSNPIAQSIFNKATEHAKMRMSKDLNPFAQEGEDSTTSADTDSFQGDIGLPVDDISDKAKSFAKGVKSSTVSGLKSAWKSISKEGEWGTLYGDYYESVTGETIHDSLKKGINADIKKDSPNKYAAKMTFVDTAAPTIEMLANIISDPIIVFGEASRLAQLKVPKHWKGKMDPKVVAEIEKLEKLEGAEKQVLRQKLTEALNNRADYMKWWKGKLDEMDKVGPPLAKPKPQSQMTAPQRAMVGQPKRDFATKKAPEVSPTMVHGKTVPVPEKKVPVRAEQLSQKKSVGVEEFRDELIAEGTQEKLGTKVKAPTKIKTEIQPHEVPQEYVNLLNQAKQAKRPNIAKSLRKEALDKYNILRNEHGYEPFTMWQIERAVEGKAKANLNRVNEFRNSKGLSPFTARATGGAILGVEEDEDGNLQYNLGKGLAGTLLVAGGLKFKGKGAKKLVDTLSKNPAWAKVHSMVGEKKRSFEFAGLLGKIDTKLFSRFGALRKKSPETYKAARTFSSFKDQAKLKFQELVDGLALVKDSEVLITDYITAHRAYSRASRGIPNPKGVTLAESREAIKEIEEAYVASGKNVEDLRNSLNSFQDWTNKYILKEALDSGILSKAGYDDILKNNKWYATFDVLDHLPSDLNKIPSNISGEYFSVSNQKIIQKMVGTEKEIANPIEATIRKFTQAQQTFARNKVASTFIDDPGAKELFRPMATSKKEFAILKNKGLNPVMQGAWDKKSFDTINRFKDGRVERYVVDKDIADAMKQLTPFQAPKAIQAINAVFRASATTLYLPFTISNAMRDMLMAYTTAPVHTAGRPDKFARDWAKGFWEGAKHEFLGSSDLAAEYIKSGGGFGYVGDLRQSKLAKNQLFKKGIIKQSTDIITSPFKLIEKISATIELAPRLGTFERAKMVGMDGKDAALTARQSTIDFNRGGTWTKVVNQFVPFLNARVQGRVTLGNALKNNPKATLAKAAVSVGLPGVGAYAWNRLYYSDLYDDIPEYIRQNYFTVITGTHKDEKGKISPQYLVISKGDLGQMAWNPIEFGLDQMWEKDREGTTKFLVNYLSDLSPVEFAREGKLSASKAASGLMPPVVKGFAEDWANLKFYTGREIVPYYMGKSKPPELQYKENTPESYKWLGKKTGIAPLRIQNFASNILAGYGREGLDPSAMLRGLTGRIVKTRGGEIESKAWTVIKDIEQGYTYNRAMAEEMVKSGERNAALKLIHEWNAGLSKQVREYNKQFSGTQYRDKGGLIKSYRFTPDKIRNLLKNRRNNRSAIEKRLSRQKR